MSPMIICQIQTLRDLACRRFATTDELLAITAALKEAAAEADRALTNRLEAAAAEAWERGDWL
jgi:hypothetical protein